MLTTAGTLSGVIVWVIAAAPGLAALLRASEIAYDVLRFVGAAYLLWLGSVRCARAAACPSPPCPRATRAGYLTGVVTNLANPKRGAIFTLEAAAWFAVLLWGVSRLAAWLQQPRIQRRLEGVTGVVLVGFAIRLATERR